jgi:fatty acid desaturase
MEVNPYASNPPNASEPQAAARSASPDSANARDDADRFVSDTVIGFNTRRSDNRLQAIWIGGSMLLAACAMAFAAWWRTDWELPWYGGALIGAFLGMVFGFFTSGIYLMVYRLVHHLRRSNS